MSSKMAAKSLKFQLFSHSSYKMTHFDALLLLVGLIMVHNVLHAHRSQNRNFEIQDG